MTTENLTSAKKESGWGTVLAVAGLATLAYLFSKKHSVPAYKLPELEYDGDKVRENWKRVLNNES